MVIDPAKSSVTLNWEHDSKTTYKAEGLDKVMDAGYGEFSFSGTQDENGVGVDYRANVELTADRFYYCWEKSDNGTDYFATGEWMLTREFGASGPTVPHAPGATTKPESRLVDHGCPSAQRAKSVGFE